MEKERIIKKYPNRRLYDSAISAYITLEDIRRLVREGMPFRVVDARTEEDITRGILLQVILEQEERGQPIFSREILEQLIRSYGDAMQGFMTSYLEQSM
jgi:polyhydroxyalkanoate synthesis repressor PhaR